MFLKSPAFADGGSIPRRYTCQGEEISPPLTWGDAPEDAESLVLFMYDVDVPSPSLRLSTIDHWIVYNIPPTLEGLPEAVPDEERLDVGATQGRRWGGRTGYMGPCPLTGAHEYMFELHAVDRMLDVEPSRATRKTLRREMRGHTLAEALYRGTYRKE
ncbi:YbhB/YbcL family Raf kinase inhibitor-like protein [Candidatus Bathyarchaeota archaeon]|nr:YbhB/YbcL family Raf kinase inhibitor-like protein [Candidatus Bathyarchaeota archaeon]